MRENREEGDENEWTMRLLRFWLQVLACWVHMSVAKWVRDALVAAQICFFFSDPPKSNFLFYFPCSKQQFLYFLYVFLSPIFAKNIKPCSCVFYITQFQIDPPQYFVKPLFLYLQTSATQLIQLHSYCNKFVSTCNVYHATCFQNLI